MVSNDDDADFDAAMRRMGVEKLSGKRDRARARSDGGNRARERSPAPARPSNRSRMDDRARRGGGQGHRARPTPKPQPTAAKELEQLRRQLAEAQGARDQLQTQLAEARGARDQLQTQLADERARWRDERANSEQAWRREREAWCAREAAQREQLRASEQTLSSLSSLQDALRARGCIDEREMIAVLRGLVDKRAKELLSAGAVGRQGAFAKLLDQRVVFVADGVDLSDDLERDSTCVVIRVPPKRCEITGGSDIQAGYRRFVYACRQCGVQCVTIVGGSPAYRRQLQHLSKRFDDTVRLNLVSGTQRRTRKRAEADMRSSQLVIIWGATELDHSVSAVYTKAPEKIIRVRHRGISRMFLYLADELERRCS